MDYNFVQQEEKLFSKKNLIPYLILAIFILAIPLGVKLVQTQTQLKSRAAGGDITFRGTGVTCPATGECSATEAQIEVVLDSPFGSPLPAAGP